MKTTKACYSQTLFLLYVNVFTLFKKKKKRKRKRKKKTTTKKDYKLY